ncbi:hypothetical protein SAMN05661010_00022 [Modicisalibacter muralis]|uniref:Uncharacterized protein n=2 Tax=Modicisalibacter muralis TaxID=119000 RepID=A0A1G9ELJ0_9GAMM|nr:hypothetical protein SAMN05661010_00022 [Halomonas muralis]
MSLALLACQPQTSERAVKLQKEAASTLAQGVANSSDKKVSTALDLVNESLGIAPNHVPSLVTRANINIYERRYEKALKDIISAQEIKPKDRSLNMLECLLKERSQGKKAAIPCYAALEKEWAKQHQEGEPIDINWVAAAYLANSGNRQDLKTRYLQQKKSQGSPDYLLAKKTIQSLEQGRYLQLIMPGY